MNSIERVQAVLDHGIPDRIPVALHNFLMACTMAKADLSVALRDGEMLAEVQLAAWREFGHDVIMHENGVCAEAEAMGCGIWYQKDLPPHVDERVIHSLADVDKLQVPDPESTFPLNEMLKATRILVRETKGEVFVMGRADQGPIALALALCGPEQFLTWIMEPESRPRVLRLLDLCSKVNIAFGEAQKRAGAHGSSLGSVGLSLISPRLFDEFERPRVKAFCDAMRTIGARSFIHSCGNETRLIENLIATGADCLELDPLTDPAILKERMKKRVSVLGMLDSTHILPYGGTDAIRQHTIEIMARMAPGGGFLLGPGCALTAAVPSAAIHTVMECARSFGHYAPDGSLPALPRLKPV
ncbi:MAG: uroporphyrinogen decarboxylase family protein [Terriglobia bacterium]